MVHAGPDMQKWLDSVDPSQSPLSDRIRESPARDSPGEDDNNNDVKDDPDVDCFRVSNLTISPAPVFASMRKNPATMEHALSAEYACDVAPRGGFSLEPFKLEVQLHASP